MSGELSEVEKLYSSPLAARTRELNQRLKEAINGESEIIFCDCCSKPIKLCSCNGGCE